MSSIETKKKEIISRVEEMNEEELLDFVWNVRNIFANELEKSNLSEEEELQIKGSVKVCNDILNR